MDLARVLRCRRIWPGCRRRQRAPRQGVAEQRVDARRSASQRRAQDARRAQSRLFYEREAGALFAHVQEADEQDVHGRRRRHTYAHIYARAKELVVGYLTNVGNYDYVFQWIFRQDGSFGFEAELQGLILNKTVGDMTCSVCEREAQGGPG